MAQCHMYVHIYIYIYIIYYIYYILYIYIYIHGIIGFCRVVRFECRRYQLARSKTLVEPKTLDRSANHGEDVGCGKQPQRHARKSESPAIKLEKLFDKSQKCYFISFSLNLKL